MQHQHQHQHTHQAAAHVINMEGGGGNESPPGPHIPSPPDIPPGSPRGGQQLPTLGQLWKGMQGAVPFILLLLTKILYDHRLGTFLILFVCVVYSYYKC